MTAMSEQERADRVAIRHLMARYNINGDRGRVDELAATFAEDGAIEFSGEKTVGRAAVFTRLSGGDGKTARNPALTVSRHHITTSLVDIDGDRASGRTYFQVLTDIGLDHHGVYVDAIAKIDGEWHFTHREVRIDWQSPHSLYGPLHVRGKAPVAA